MVRTIHIQKSSEGPHGKPLYELLDASRQGEGPGLPDISRSLSRQDVGDFLAFTAGMTIPVQLSIGTDAGGERFFSGLLADLRIYNAELSADGHSDAL